MEHDKFTKIFAFQNPENSASCSLISHEIIEIYENYSSENTVEQKAIFWDANEELLTDISGNNRKINIDPSKIETTI